MEINPLNTLNRRQFMQGITASALLLPSISLAKVLPASVSRYYSARVTQDGRYLLSGFELSGKHLFDTPLPSRGHGLSPHPLLNHVVAVARRPETYLIVVDGEGGHIIHSEESRENRHFYGHSLYSTDGRWLYTSENDVVSGQGFIGVRDVENGYQQVAEYSSHGIGPHELAMLADGNTLVVANGGILTRPETGRSKLNIDNMSPSLTYLNAQTGALLEEQKLPVERHKNSIRHFAVNQDDQVCFAMQYQGKNKQSQPLIGLHRRGEALQLMSAPDAIQQQMHHYCGSVCSDRAGEWFAVSSPKGNLITFWSAKDARFKESIEVNDGCGIAAGAHAGEFILSSGAGGIYQYQIGRKQLQSIEALSNLKTRWDNHIAWL